MLSRIRVVLGIALLLSLMTSVTGFAKGCFSFIVIAGPNLKETVRATDSVLTEDFFAFADFFRDRAKAPTEPGIGYEITRYYIDGSHEIAFDRLHYYPDTGFVYYDGIVNGRSEYDGEWYTASPDIKTVFESALSIQTGTVGPPEKQQPVTSVSQPEESIAQLQPIAWRLRSLPVISIAVAAGLIALFVFAIWRRKPSIQ